MSAGPQAKTAGGKEPRGETMLYVGIDVHSREHRVAILPASALKAGLSWRSAKSLRIRNNASDYLLLDQTVRAMGGSARRAKFVVDATGGHYSEPLVRFLQSKGCAIYHLESKAMKQARLGILD